MDSPARKRLQRPFSEVEIGQKFQMVNSVMKAAIPGSQVFRKINEDTAQHEEILYKIRSAWPCEIVDQS